MRQFVGAPFERLGGAMIDPVVILPAALPLDLCGESVRARLCMFTDNNNRDMVLRPDLTLPVALAEIEQRKGLGAESENVYRYAATAFRQPAVSSEPMEFTQVGFERFGAASSAEIDADAYELVSQVAAGAGVKTGVARFGDLSIVPAFIDALDVSPAVQAGLRRAFREAGGVAAYLERAAQPRNAFIASLEGLDRGAVEAKLRDKLTAEAIKHFGNRTSDEVVTRLMEQAGEGQQGTVPADARKLLEAVLAVDCHPREAAGILRKIADTADVGPLDAALDRLETCFAIIESQAPRFIGDALFSPAFGRRFTYYDGFVFEIGEPGDRMARPFGAGGRYDRLLSDLSDGEVSATAIGGVVRPDRMTLAGESGS